MIMKVKEALKLVIGWRRLGGITKCNTGSWKRKRTLVKILVMFEQGLQFSP